VSCAKNGCAEQDAVWVLVWWV